MKKFQRKRKTLRIETLERRRVLAAPVAANDLLPLAQDQALDLRILLANDKDADGDVLGIASTTTPAHGNVATVNGQLTFTPNAGYVGSDTFNYTISDPLGNQSTATVNLVINAAVDVAAARAQILNGVGTSLSNPTQPGYIAVYGPTAFSIVHENGSTSSKSFIAGSSLGNGRVIVFNDHQWSEMGSHGSDASISAFYKNGIDWLGDQVSGTPESKQIKVVTLNNTANRTWLQSQGYTNVVNATWATLSAELANADVLVSGWMGNNVSDANRLIVENYVKAGGGLMVADYAPGYVWWWNKPVDQAPANLLLRDAGIFLLPEIYWGSGAVPVQHSADLLTGYDVLNIINRSVTVDQATESLALQTFSSLMARLPATDSLRSALNAAYRQHRVGEIQATPATPISDAFSKTKLSAEASWLSALSVDELLAHPTAAAVYGAIPTNAPRTNAEVLSIDVSKTGLLATGVYAAPGEVVTIQVPASLVDKGYSFQISGHYDDISGRGSWERIPYGIAKSFNINATTMRVGSVFGGTIYLNIGSEAFGTAPTIGVTNLTVTGALKAPTFVLGDMTDAQWMIERNLPAPYAELISDRFAMSVPSDWIRNLNNPTALMEYWDKAVEIQDWVGAIENIRTGPQRVNVDVQISVGLLHAGYPIQGPTWASRELVQLDNLKSEGNWGYFHELGHEHQRNVRLSQGWDSPWTFDGDIEVTVNIFANASLEAVVDNVPTSGWGYSANRELTMASAITTVNDASKPTFDTKDPYPFYFQLADGPWGFQGYRDVFATYVEDSLTTPSQLPTTNQQEKDQWLIRWSQESGYDMRQYMSDKWKLEVSPSALATVAAMNLPSWLPLAIDTDVEKVTMPASSSSVSTTLNLSTAGIGMDGVATFISAGNPTNGQLVSHGNGTFTWHVNPGFIGKGTFDVTYESSAGNRQTFPVTIETVKQGVRADTFLNVGGASLQNLRSSSKFPNAPDRVDRLTSFETVSDQADNYGVRARAFLTVPVTGDYTFWIASDDEGELLLSTDSNPVNAVKIASVPGWTSSRQWTKFTNQKSVVKSLVEGESYYIEALMKEGGGGDNLAIAWSSPEMGITDPTVIASQYLRYFGADVDKPEAVKKSAGLSEGGQVVLSTAHLKSSDPDSQSNLLNYRIDTLPTKGQLTVNSQPVVVGTTFTELELVQGKVAYQHNGSNASTDQFGFAMIDQSGNQSSPQVFDIALTAVYDDIQEAKLATGVQRSNIKKFQVTFGELVDFTNNNPLNAFNFVRRENGASVGLVLDSIDESSGVTVVNLSFTGTLTRGSGSLVDGNYQMNVIGSQFTIRGTQTNGINFTVGDDTNDKLFALLGDSNGDRTNNLLDFSAFRASFGSSTSDANYREASDANGDGLISLTDFAQFRSQFGKTMNFQ